MTPFTSVCIILFAMQGSLRSRFVHTLVGCNIKHDIFTSLLRPDWPDRPDGQTCRNDRFVDVRYVLRPAHGRCSPHLCSSEFENYCWQKCVGRNMSLLHSSSTCMDSTPCILCKFSPQRNTYRYSFHFSWMPSFLMTYLS